MTERHRIEYRHTWFTGSGGYTCPDWTITIICESGDQAPCRDDTGACVFESAIEDPLVEYVGPTPAPMHDGPIHVEWRPNGEGAQWWYLDA